VITLQELCQQLDQLYQPGSFRDYCPNGLQVEGREEVKKIATAVSANLETLEEAKERGVDCLIVHHGLFWKGEDPRIQGSKREKIRLLLDEGISLLGYHLPMDAHLEIGNNAYAARQLGMTELEPFGEVDGLFIGVKGKVAPCSGEELQSKLEEYYTHSAAVALGGPQQIDTIGIVSGGGWKFLSEAAKKGVDAMVSGNYDEPAWSMAFEEKVHFYALGHSATERVGPKALAEWLQKEMGLSAEFIDCYNPF